MSFAGKSEGKLQNVGEKLPQDYRNFHKITETSTRLQKLPQDYNVKVVFQHTALELL